MTRDEIKDILDTTNISPIDEMNILEYIDKLEDNKDVLKRIQDYIDNQSITSIEVRLIIKDILDEWCSNGI